MPTFINSSKNRRRRNIPYWYYEFGFSHQTQIKDITRMMSFIIPLLFMHIDEKFPVKT
jgi:hypothetical protein